LCINDANDALKTGQNPMRKILLSVAVAVACLAGDACAVISVGPSGTVGPLTFDLQPTVADGWSTLGVGNWDGTFVGTSYLDAYVIAVTSAATVTTALGTSTTMPPSQNAMARWNKVGHWLQTRPVGNDYLILMATLQNDTACAVSALSITEDWDQKNTRPVSEQIPGHRVFWSLSGNAGSWVLIPELSTFDVNSGAQTLSATVALGSWTAGSPLYIIWVDDNGSGSTADPMEGAYTLDNIIFSVPINPAPPAFANATDPTNRTVLQGASTTLSATASGCPASTYQWYKEDRSHPISDATNSSHTLANIQPADAGVYFVAAYSSQGVAESHHATVTVTPAPALTITPINDGAITGVNLSWNAPDFALESSTTLAAGSWSTVAGAPVGGPSWTVSPISGRKFYRLHKP
jgi:hypothetical protein